MLTTSQRPYLHCSVTVVILERKGFSYLCIMSTITKDSLILQLSEIIRGLHSTHTSTPNHHHHPRPRLFLTMSNAPRFELYQSTTTETSANGATKVRKGALPGRHTPSFLAFRSNEQNSFVAVPRGWRGPRPVGVNGDRAPVPVGETGRNMFLQAFPSVRAPLFLGASFIFFATRDRLKRNATCLTPNAKLKRERHDTAGPRLLHPADQNVHDRNAVQGCCTRAVHVRQERGPVPVRQQAPRQQLRAPRVRLLRLPCRGPMGALDGRARAAHDHGRHVLASAHAAVPPRGRPGPVRVVVVAAVAAQTWPALDRVSRCGGVTWHGATHGRGRCFEHFRGCSAGRQHACTDT